MSGLVRNSLDVVLGTVEIRKNERDAVVVDARAVAAALFALGREKIHQLAVKHRLEELTRLRREVVIESLCCGKDSFVIACRFRIAGPEHQSAVRKAQRILHAEALRLFSADAVSHRDYVFLDRLMELVDIIAVVAVPGHAVVSELDIILHSKLTGHLISDGDETVIKFIQLVLVISVPAAFGLPCLEPRLIIRVMLERSDLSDSISFAPKRDRSARKQFLISGRQFVLLLQQRDDRRIERLHLKFRINKNDFPEFFRKRAAERRSA